MDLPSRQEAGEQVEKKLLLWLLNFEPAHSLKIEDAKAIAYAARNISFDEFV